MQTMPGRAGRHSLVPIAGLFSATLIVSLILAGKIVTVAGITFSAAVFVMLAFGGVFQADELLRIGLGAWILKVAWEVAALPLSLSFIAWLKREEGEDHFERDTDLNPFRLKG